MSRTAAFKYHDDIRSDVTMSIDRDGVSRRVLDEAPPMPKSLGMIQTDRAKPEPGVMAFVVMSLRWVVVSASVLFLALAAQKFFPLLFAWMGDR